MALLYDTRFTFFYQHFLFFFFGFQSIIQFGNFLGYGRISGCLSHLSLHILFFYEYVRVKRAISSLK